MPLLKNPNLFESAADELLRNLTVKTVSGDKLSKRDQLAAALEDKNLTIDTIAEKLQEQIFCGDKNIEDRALEKLMRIHNVLPKEEAREVPQITFNIQGGSPLMNILLPQRS